MRTIGIAGTAKNTGKTTTALEIIGQSEAAHLNVALTSIGYDGECRDNITGLPKPRYYLPRGTCLATAERCLRAGTARYTVTMETGVRTVLGPILIAEINKPGLVVIAGPNRAADLQRILELFEDSNVDLTIVDGALNRIVPLIRTGGLVLCTGAALDERISYVAEHARAWYDLFIPEQAQNDSKRSRSITITSSDGAVIELETGSLLDEETARQVYRMAKGSIYELVIPGACDSKIMQHLLDHGSSHLAGARLLFGSPLKLVASGAPLLWSQLLTEARARGQVVQYIETIPLRFLTANPFYPRYLSESGTYEPATVDNKVLLNTIRNKLAGFPVFDIKQPPVPDLLSLIEVHNEPMPTADSRWAGPC